MNKSPAKLSDAVSLAFVGDDFTGSIDTLATLAGSGLNTVLFLNRIDWELGRRFGTLDAFGVATETRSMAPPEMTEALKPLFLCIADTGAQVVHYKICSTFDSSPISGNLDCVLKASVDCFPHSHRVIVVGQPNLGRFGAFGNLFASMGSSGETYRIDRHPVMSQHPITPMNEGDMRLHIAAQAPANTDIETELIDCFAISNRFDAIRSSLENHSKVLQKTLFVDLFQEDHHSKVGNILEALSSPDAPVFIIGSSGVECSLLAHWMETGQTSFRETFITERPSFPSVPQLVAVSGSCSSISADQIEHAIESGFQDISVDPVNLLCPTTHEASHRKLQQAILDIVEDGKSLIVHTCKGPGDPRRARVIDHFLDDTGDTRLAASRAGHFTAEAIATVISSLTPRMKLPRYCFAGGDFSSAIVRTLDIGALTHVAQISPGVSISKTHSHQSGVDGLELALKGGQMGKLDYFARVRDGSVSSDDIISQ